MRPRLLTATVTTALALTLGAAPALAADGVYPPAGVRVVTGLLSAEQVVEGGEVTFSGSGFAPAALLRLSVDGVDLRTLSADSSGAFSTPVALTGLGEHVLAASGLEPGGRVRVVSATVDVLSAEIASSSGGLPTSGAEVAPALAGGLGLVVLGAGVTHLARRRRSLA